VPELMQAIRGSTQGADGSEPIFLLNAQRVSGYTEIALLPPEAIEKVEVLPEQAALKFGFPPTRRVVNFITKARFRQFEVKASAGTTTRRGSATEKANLGMTRLQDGARLTIGLEYRRADPLLQSDRNIAPDPGILFDAIGNITAASGGEIDPALSAAAGQVVTIAPVPRLLRAAAASQAMLPPQTRAAASTWGRAGLSWAETMQSRRKRWLRIGSAKRFQDRSAFPPSGAGKGI
jgi:iron complex outermembrane recepter protein